MKHDVGLFVHCHNPTQNTLNFSKALLAISDPVMARRPNIHVDHLSGVHIAIATS